MTVREVTFYQVVCDRCGAIAQEGGEYAAWATRQAAVDEAHDAMWLCGEWDEVEQAGHWCDDCTEWNEEEDARVPKPKPQPADGGGA